MKTKLLLVGLKHYGRPIKNVLIETRGLCRPEVCKSKAAAPLYEYNVIIIYPKSYSHFIFGHKTRFSTSAQELWDLKKYKKSYDLDDIFCGGDRAAELDAAIRQGSRVIWLATLDKPIHFFGWRSLYNSYLNESIYLKINSWRLFKKISKKLFINTTGSFYPYFNQFKVNGWSVCWDFRNEDITSLAYTPEGYSLGCELALGDRKSWLLTPPTSKLGVEALIKSVLSLSKAEVQIQKYHGIFLCHCHEDKLFVRKLRGSLLRRGVTDVWVDEAEIMIGDSLLSKIAGGIDKTRYFGIVLSPRSVKSSWVQHELEQAMNIEITSKRVKVLPLLYDKCELPTFIKGKLYADFTSRALYKESIAKLLRRLEIQL